MPLPRISLGQVMLFAGVIALCAVSLLGNTFAAQWMAGNSRELWWVFTALALGSGLVKLGGSVYLERQWSWGLGAVVAVALTVDCIWSLGFTYMTRELAARPGAQAARAYADAKRQRDEAHAALSALPAPARGLLALRTERDGLNARDCDLDRNKQSDRCRAVAKLDADIAAASEYEAAQKRYDAKALAFASVDLPTSTDPLAAALGNAMRAAWASATDEHAKLAFGLLMILLFELAPMKALPAALRPPKPAVHEEPSRVELALVKNSEAGVKRLSPVSKPAGGQDFVQSLRTLADAPPAGISPTATGGLCGSQRALAGALGLNPAAVNAQLKAAAAAGQIVVTPSTRGTSVEFVSNVVALRA